MFFTDNFQFQINISVDHVLALHCLWPLFFNSSHRRVNKPSSIFHLISTDHRVGISTVTPTQNHASFYNNGLGLSFVNLFFSFFCSFCTFHSHWRCNNNQMNRFFYIVLLLYSISLFCCTLTAAIYSILLASIDLLLGNSVSKLCMSSMTSKKNRQP